MRKFLYFAALCVFVLIGCSKENKKLEVTPESISVYSEGTAQITTNVDDAAFSVKDDFYATVDNTGLVTGNKVGETEILVSSSSGTSTIPITILHKYSLYPELDPLVGKTVSEMKQLLGSNFESSTSSSGTLTYAYKNPTSYCEIIMCSMEGSKIASAGALIPTSNMTKLTNYLKERYVIAGMQNDNYFFLNHDKDVVIGLSVYSLKYLLVLYAPYTSSKADNAIDFSHFKESFQGVIAAE